MNVLLSSPILPMPNFRNGRDHLRNNFANTTYGQDIFSIPTSTHYYGLHLIAQNISEQTKILENPKEKNFIHEIKKHYDVVGIYFVIPFFFKVLQMCKLVRRYSPASKIILGGPGVQCFSHTTGNEAELLELVDYVCHGDGIPFMRRLLNEKIENPLRQNLPLSAALPFNSKYLSQQSPIIISALGCSNKCEFCAGSAFFNHKVKRLVSPKQLLEIIKAYINGYGITSARIIDDNFLSNKNYVKELGYLITKDNLCQESNFSYTAFGNLAAISKYEYEELVENGISGILIGVESKFVDKLDPNIRRKLLNLDTRNIFQNLHDNGIHTEGSMILGWDFHTPSNIMDDINFYASLQATFDQILCLGPLPETKLWQQLKIEKRLFNDFSWEDIGFYGKWHRFKNFTHEQLWEYEALAQKKCYETWGPSYLRLFEVQLKGYKKFIRSKNSVFQRAAKAHQLECILMYPLLQCIKIYSPNERVRKRTVELRKEFVDEFGKPKLPDIIKSTVVTSIASWCKLKTIFSNEHTIQPSYKTYCYN